MRRLLTRGAFTKELSMASRFLLPSPASLVRVSMVLVALSALAACTSTTCGSGGSGDGGVSAVCGNHVCEATESAASCPADCTGTTVCGNHVCEATENATTCAVDCATHAVCGNHVCESGESAATCPADCTSLPVCGNHVCEGSETPASCPGDCPTIGCPSVAGNYVLALSPAADPSCPAGTSNVTITQSGCALTVDGIFPTPLSFSIDPAGVGVYPYSMGGLSGTLTFAFFPMSNLFDVTDTGLNALCPGVGTRS